MLRRITGKAFNAYFSRGVTKRVPIYSTYGFLRVTDETIKLALIGHDSGPGEATKQVISNEPLPVSVDICSRGILDIEAVSLIPSHEGAVSS